MLNLDQINDTIAELENSATTFDTCLKLASLYIVREHQNNVVETKVPSESPAQIDQVESELADVLPYYRKYCEVKRAWQMQNADQEHVIQGMERVCNEIREFVQTLYSGTSSSSERLCIKEMCSSLYSSFSSDPT